MELRKEELIKRPVYVYDLPPDILSTLTRKVDTDEGPHEETIQSFALPMNVEIKDGPENIVGSKSCSLCAVSGYTVEDQKSHVRSDLHRYNLKEKLRGGKPVNEVDFEKLVGDLNESLSGSESSDSEGNDNGDRKESTLSNLLKKQAAISANEDGAVSGPRERTRGLGKSPLIWFSTPTLPVNAYLGIYRAIFTNNEQSKGKDIVNSLRAKQLTPLPTPKIPSTTLRNDSLLSNEPIKSAHIFLCMIGGGHFAAMIVSLLPKHAQSRASSTGPFLNEVTVLAQKTFHRYTTRRKQGGSQSANDSAKGAAHSAGSSLRRYNEQALTEEVRELLREWKGKIETSELLFVRATGNTNRRTLFGPYEGQVLRQNDEKIRGFPFNTRRATHNELLRAFIELTRLRVVQFDPEARKSSSENATLSATSKTNKQPVTQTPKLSEEEQTAILHTQQIQTLIRRSKLPALLSYLAKNSLPTDLQFTPYEHHTTTPLHLAASLSNALVIEGLLVKAFADPTSKNGESKTAFEIAPDRRTRDAFRLCRHLLGENKWPWSAIGVGTPLTRPDFEQRDLQEKENERARELERREDEETRLRDIGPKVEEKGMGRRQEAGRNAALGTVGKTTAEEKRGLEMQGLSAEGRLRVERERRARAAEDRMRRAQGGG